MTSRYSSIRTSLFARVATITALATPIVLLTGCGSSALSHEASSAATNSTVAIKGINYGGPNPIIGATIKLYTTGYDPTGLATYPAAATQSGYGVATLRQEANAVDNGASYPAGDTDTNGYFNFAGGYNCPAGQFAYIVGAGGNTGASTTGGGATATGTYSGVTSITINNNGSSYSANPTVTITPSDGIGGGATPGTTAATAAATVTTGAVTKITVLTAGTGYDAPPTVTITDGTGTGATATANYAANGGLSSLVVTAAGSNYYSATVTITPSDGLGSGATATAVINPANGQIASIKVTNTGSGYDAAPNVTITNGVNGVYNPPNNNAVLVAALGRCEDLYTNSTYTGSPIYLNELTTVAAAYALGHFSQVVGTGATTVISIGAPDSNNAAQINGVSTGCVAGISTCATTATAGLAHAFQNAANLVNPFQTTALSGANNTVATPYSSYITGYSGAVPLVPAPVINSIANTLVSCVNSAGGVANDGSACGTIFKVTTLPAGIAANYDYTTGTAAPTNTFSAMVNLAANPSLSGSTTNVTTFFNIAGSFTSVYAPALTAAPTQDWSIAINYPESVGTGVGTGVGSTTGSANAVCAAPPCQGLSFTTTGAVDINDVFYTANNSSASGAVPVNVLAFGSNGKLLGMTSNTSGASGMAYAAGLSVDALGYGYFGAGSASTYNLGVFTTGGGSVGSLSGSGSVSSTITTKTIGTNQNYGTAVDLANNIWAAGSGANIYKAPAGVAGGGLTITGVSTYALGATLVPSTTLKNIGIQVDPNQNIWFAAGPTTATNLNVLTNTGTVLAPTYATSGGTVTDTTSVGPVGGITFAGSPFVAYIGGYNTTPGIQPITPAFASGVGVSGVSNGTSSGAGSETGADLLQADGTGAIYATNFSNGAIATQFWASGSATGYKLNPCVITTLTATSCAPVFGTGGLPKPQFVAIDSAGSTWVGGALPTSATKGGLIEIIGTAAPTVPLISLGKQGQLP